MSENIRIGMDFDNSQERRITLRGDVPNSALNTLLKLDTFPNP